jgi:peptide/nickel transport system ATP-binding protein
VTPILDIAAFSLSYRTESGTAPVLDSIALTVAPAEIVGLVGESGSGKTTLVRAILGTLPAHQARIDGGHIRICGTEMLTRTRTAAQVRGRLVTFVPQDPLASLNPLFSIGTQILDIMRSTAPREEGRWIGRRDRHRAAALAMLDAVQLPDPHAVLRQYPHQLSGGQRQRVMIALALLAEPKLIVADEATAALDVSVQAQILLMFRRIAAERGVAILFATHDLGVTWEICDRIAVMYAGQLVEVAHREAFFTDPRHPYTRQLLASLPNIGRKPDRIPGGLPDVLLPSAGCRFHPRCARVTEICRHDRPQLGADQAGHQVACHHPFPPIAAA